MGCVFLARIWTNWFPRLEDKIKMAKLMLFEAHLAGVFF
jgi:hypothetical protein